MLGTTAPSLNGRVATVGVFLYDKVLGMNLPWLKNIASPRFQTRLPVVLTLEEVTST
jgi:hypothetical protein